FGDVRAEDGGRRDLRNGRTGIENVYPRRRLRKGCEAAGQPDQGRIRPRASVTHLAGLHTFSGVVHRTNLPGQHSWTALVVGIRGGHFLATKRERRGGNTRHLAHQPAANHPRKMPASEGHRHVSLPRRFAGMMEAIPVRNLAIQFFVSVVVCLCVSASTASAQEHQHPAAGPGPATTEQSWSWATDANAFFGYNYQ